MSRDKHSLTNTKISRLKTKSSSYLVSDGDRLYLCVRPNKTKLWVFIYTSPTMFKKRRTSFGLYPDVSLLEARDKAKEYREQISKGIDPIDYLRDIKVKTKLSNKLTFNKVLNEWLQLQKVHLAKSTYEKKRNQLKKDFGIPLGNIPITKIHHSQIAKIIKLKAISTAETANRYLGYLNNLWQYSCTMGYTETNIIANLHRASLIPQIQSKSYAKIVDPIILSELIEFIYSYTGNLTIRNAMKFLLYLPLRISNLINLKWENINFSKRVLRIKREDMKVKNINLPDFKIYLVDEVIKLLKEMKLYNKNSEYIFNIDGKRISNESINRVLQRGGFNDENRGRKQRSHSFRGTFLSLTETYSDIHNIPNEVGDLVLDHIIGNNVRLAYANKANNFTKTKKLLIWWESFVLDVRVNPEKWVIE